MRLGEDGYRTLSNNCEHLCEWCIHGENRSRQVEMLRLRSLGTLNAGLRFLGAPLRLLLLMGHAFRGRLVTLQ